MTSSTPVDVIPVWPGVAPGSEEWTHQEITYLSDKQELPVDSWIERFGDWLRAQGVL